MKKELLSKYFNYNLETLEKIVSEKEDKYAKLVYFVKKEDIYEKWATISFFYHNAMIREFPVFLELKISGNMRKLIFISLNEVSNPFIYPISKVFLKNKYISFANRLIYDEEFVKLIHNLVATNNALTSMQFLSLQYKDILPSRTVQEFFSLLKHYIYDGDIENIFRNTKRFEQVLNIIKENDGKIMRKIGVLKRYNDYLGKIKEINPLLFLLLINKGAFYIYHSVLAFLILLIYEWYYQKDKRLYNFLREKGVITLGFKIKEEE